VQQPNSDLLNAEIFCKLLPEQKKLAFSKLKSKLYQRISYRPAEFSPSVVA
jgi:hypothetical protein